MENLEQIICADLIKKIHPSWDFEEAKKVIIGKFYYEMNSFYYDKYEVKESDLKHIKDRVNTQEVRKYFLDKNSYLKAKEEEKLQQQQEQEHAKQTGQDYYNYDPHELGA